MKENKYDDSVFFEQYSHMPRSEQGLSAAGEWPALKALLPELAGKRVLIAAHGNSLRALVMQLEHLTPEEILKVNIPTGVPCSYTFDKDWNIIDKHYIGDPETIEKKINAVANQGKAKK